MTCKAEQASYLNQVDHFAQIIFLLKQAQYQIHVECGCRQQVNHVSKTPKEINPMQHTKNRDWQERLFKQANEPR